MLLHKSRSLSVRDKSRSPRSIVYIASKKWVREGEKTILKNGNGLYVLHRKGERTAPCLQKILIEASNQKGENIIFFRRLLDVLL